MKTKEDILFDNEKIIYSIINKYTYYFDKDDLYQVGVIGLIDAYNNYKDDRNTKFSSFAYFYILGRVKEYIRKSNTFKVSRELIKLNSSVERARECLTQRLGFVPNDNDIAMFLEIDVSQIEDARNAFCMVSSLDGDELDESSLYDYVGYVEKNYSEEILDLKTEIRNLPCLDREIIVKRYEEGLTQSEVSQELGINQVKVSRMEKKILGKLRTRLR